MAKRFGRNQKRKMREKIETLNASQKNMHRAVNYAEARVLKAEATVREIATRLIHAVGVDSALVPMDMQDLKSINYNGDLHRIEARDMAPLTFDAPAPKDMTTSAIDVLRLVVEVEDRFEQFDTVVRFGSRHPETGFFSYNISRAALRNVGIGGNDIAYLGKMVAQKLAVRINEKHGVKPW